MAEVDIADYGFTVIGKPVHTGSLTDSVTDALRNLVLSRDQGTKVGVFGGGQCSTSSDGISKIKQTIPMSSEVAILNALVAKIGNSEDLNTRAQDFVNQLINIKKL